MITGSHNPAELQRLQDDAGQGAVLRRRDPGDRPRSPAPAAIASGPRAKRRDGRVFEAYVERLAVGLSRHGRPADGGLGRRQRRRRARPWTLLARLSRAATCLLDETIDGSFPNHHPDPTVPENLGTCRPAVIAETAASSASPSTATATASASSTAAAAIVWGDQLMLLCARDDPGRAARRHHHRRRQGEPGAVRRDRAAGGEPLMWKTGHSLIKAKMAETGAPLAGEMSGHIFFADGYYGFDDALYAAVRLLDIVARRDAEPGRRCATRCLAVVNTPELRFHCSEERKFAVIEESPERLRRAGARGQRHRRRAGAARPTAGGLLRASNTQDVLVARCESPDGGGSRTAEGRRRGRAHRQRHRGAEVLRRTATLSLAVMAGRSPGRPRRAAVKR